MLRDKFWSEIIFYWLS